MIAPAINVENYTQSRMVTTWDYELTVKESSQ